MTLSDLRSFLKSKNGASLRDMVSFFELDVETMSAILQHWIRKGLVQHQRCVRGCSGCAGCPLSMLNAMYYWVV